MALFASNLFIRKIISLSGDLFYLVAFQGKCRKKKTQTSNHDAGGRREGRREKQGGREAINMVIKRQYKGQSNG